MPDPPSISRELTEAESVLLRYLVRRHADPALELADRVSPDSPLFAAVERARDQWRWIVADRGERSPPTTVEGSLHGPDVEVIDPEVSLTPPPEEPDPSPASHVDRYRILRELDRSGSERSLEVWDRNLRRTLVMNVLEGALSSLKPFLREARITARLDHPGIPPVHDSGIDPSGHVYFTRQHHGGTSLATILEHARARQEGWTPNRAVGLLQKVCETVAFAHTRGIVHTDLNPEHIRVGKFGEVHVLGWGNAWCEDDPADLVERADSSHRAPECTPGREEEIGSWSDVYSVGLMLTELFGDLPRTLGSIASLALEPASRDRTANLDRLGDELRAYLQEEQRAAEEADRARREAQSARQVSDFLVDIFLISDPHQARGNTITVREVLDRGVERIPRELGRQPATQATLQCTLARIYRNLGLVDTARELFETALATREELHGRDHSDTVALRGELATL